MTFCYSDLDTVNPGRFTVLTYCNGILLGAQAAWQMVLKSLHPDSWCALFIRPDYI